LFLPKALRVISAWRKELFRGIGKDKGCLVSLGFFTDPYSQFPGPFTFEVEGRDRIEAGAFFPDSVAAAGPVYGDLNDSALNVLIMLVMDYYAGNIPADPVCLFIRKYLDAELSLFRDRKNVSLKCFVNTSLCAPPLPSWAWLSQTPAARERQNNTSDILMRFILFSFLNL
jgi:hypothetical protein